MHSHHLKDMAAALVAAGVIAPVVEARAREVLASHWVDKIAIVWTTADVRETVSQALSDAEAAEVLQKVLRDADADRASHGTVSRARPMNCFRTTPSGRSARRHVFNVSLVQISSSPALVPLHLPSWPKDG